MARLHVFSFELLELSTLKSGRFLFRLPELLSGRNQKQRLWWLVRS